MDNTANTTNTSAHSDVDTHPDEQWFNSLADTRFTDVRRVTETGSTNTDLMQAAQAGAPEGTVLIADLQTAGRGRRGRVWEAPPGSSLMMSVLLRPPPGAVPPQSASLVTTAFACAAISAAVEAVVQVVEANRHWTDSMGMASVTREDGEVIQLCSGYFPDPRPRLQLKWPNDLVLDEGRGLLKVAGLLTESFVTDGNVDALVVGMGMNTGWVEVPEHLEDVATSLNHIAGGPINRAELAEVILRQFEWRYRSLLEGESERRVAEARARSATIGRRVKVERAMGAEPLVGKATDLTDTGALVVVDGAGEAHTVSVGEVVHAVHGPIAR